MELKNYISNGGVFSFSISEDKNNLKKFITFLKSSGFKGKTSFSYISGHDEVQDNYSCLEYVFCEHLENITEDNVKRYLKSRNLEFISEYIFTRNEFNITVRDLDPLTLKAYRVLKALIHEDDKIIFIENISNFSSPSVTNKLLQTVWIAQLKAKRSIFFTGQLPQEHASIANGTITQNKNMKFILVKDNVHKVDFGQALEDEKHAA